MAHSQAILPHIHKRSEGAFTDRTSLSRAVVTNNDIWNHTIPAESNPLDRHALTKLTRGLIPRLVDEAISQNKTRLLAKVASQVMLHNGLEPGSMLEDEVNEVTPDDIFDMLSNQLKYCPSWNTYVRYYIKSDRGKYSVKIQEVIYGNCPQCLQAMPIGHICQNCPPQVDGESQVWPPMNLVRYVYAANDYDTRFAAEHNYEMLNDMGMTPMPPMQLSWKLVGRVPEFSLDYRDFTNDPHYFQFADDEQKPYHYTVLEGCDFVVKAINSPNRDIFMTAPFQVMMEAAVCDEHEVAKAIDEAVHPWNHLPQETIDALRHHLRIYRPDRYGSPMEHDPPERDHEPPDPDMFY